MAHAFDDVVHAVDVALAEKPAVGIRWERAPATDMAIFDEVTCFSSATESECLQLEEHDGAEVFVNHCDVNIGGGNAGLPIKLLAENATFGVLTEIIVVVRKHFVATLKLNGRRGKDGNGVRSMSGPFG